MKRTKLLACVLPSALLGCASVSYPNFNDWLDNAIGKTNAQLSLPVDLPMHRYSDGELTVIEYAYARPHYCRWRFSYNAAGQITHWSYPDPGARSECAALAVQLR